MSLTLEQFAVLRRADASRTGASPKYSAEFGSAMLEQATFECSMLGYVDGVKLTDAGRLALEPYTVDNAVIMAAGMSQRFAPISYEKPKGLLNVQGEVLIERQIRQLIEAGITEITVVVGYKAEYFFYLREKFGVDIVVNSQYAVKDNHVSLWLTRDKLSNTFVCSADNFFTQNPFEKYVYEAYYSSVYSDGPTEEWCITADSNDRIINVVIGGSEEWHMLGHVYFDRRFSEAFRAILEEVYELPQTAKKPWEIIYMEHLSELDLKIRRYPAGVILEFDSLDEVRKFDEHFIENVDSEALEHISRVLNCGRSEIRNFVPLKQGITNLSCSFWVGDKQYVYRHPGVGTDKMVDRKAELEGLQLARDLELDSSFLAADPGKGWKISSFLPGARALNINDPQEFETAMVMCRSLHTSGRTLSRVFDFIDQGLGFERILASHGNIDVPGYFDIKTRVLKLKEFAEADRLALCPSHNDVYTENFLVDDLGKTSLIDWEYAGMADPGNDFGSFMLNNDLSFEQADQALEYYFGRPATFEERRHYYAQSVFAGWCWYVWALAREAEGDNIQELLFRYYRHAADNVDLVLSWYELGASSSTAPAA